MNNCWNQIEKKIFHNNFISRIYRIYEISQLWRKNKTLNQYHVLLYMYTPFNLQLTATYIGNTSNQNFNCP